MPARSQSFLLSGPAFGTITIVAIVGTETDGARYDERRRMCGNEPIDFGLLPVPDSGLRFRSSCDSTVPPSSFPASLNAEKSMVPKRE